MATRLLEYIEKAAFTTSDLSGGANGGFLSPAQARQFLRDAIEATSILSRADVFDSGNPTFEVPKISFSSRIMYAGTEGAVADTQANPDTGLVTLTAQLFKGEVPLSEETFEDNVERDGLADSLAEMIAEAVGRDLEEIAIKSSDADVDATFSKLGDGIIQQLVVAAANIYDATGDASYKEMFQSMIEALPTRYRRIWDRLALFVPVDVADGYAEELGDRGTALGDRNIEERTNLRYRGIPVVEVALMSGTQDSVDYGSFAILCDPKNLKVGFHRRVRIRQHEEPREGLHYFLPTVRYDVKWAQDTAVVLAENVPAL
jgi:HK97 family phage major capsid protein